jgi:Mlc titration factor MtfA (ptsG expression regulator)
VRDVAAVLIRPDAYVFGAAHQPAGAAGLVHALRQALSGHAADASQLGRAA